MPTQTQISSAGPSTAMEMMAHHNVTVCHIVQGATLQFNCTFDIDQDLFVKLRKREFLDMFSMQNERKISQRRNTKKHLPSQYISRKLIFWYKMRYYQNPVHSSLQFLIWPLCVKTRSKKEWRQTLQKVEK